MATSRPARISTATHDLVSELADAERRTFIAQLDVLVEAGVAALSAQTERPTRIRDRESRARTPR